MQPSKRSRVLGAALGALLLLFALVLCTAATRHLACCNTAECKVCTRLEKVAGALGNVLGGGLPLRARTPVPPLLLLALMPLGALFALALHTPTTLKTKLNI